MKIKISSLIMAAVLNSGFVYAQTSVENQAEEIPRYEVEIAIFKNIKTPKGREFVLPVSSPSKTGKLLDLSSPRSIAAARKLDYELLSSADHRLLDIVTKLVESPRYELLLHVAWRQPGLELSQALPIWVRGGRIFGNEYTSIDNQIEFLEQQTPLVDGESADKNTELDAQDLQALELQIQQQRAQQAHQGLYELEGKITIGLARYLHAYTDLVLRRPRLSADAIPSNPIRDRYLATHSADLRILNNHSLKEHRRMRSKNLHYLDNPEFSLLILITPFEAETRPAKIDAPQASTDNG